MLLYSVSHFYIQPYYWSDSVLLLLLLFRDGLVRYFYSEQNCFRFILPFFNSLSGSLSVFFKVILFLANIDRVF